MLQRLKSGVEEERGLIDNWRSVKSLLSHKSEKTCRDGKWFQWLDKQYVQKHRTTTTNRTSGTGHQHLPIIAKRPFLISFV